MEKKYPNSNFEFWGGIECTINRVNDAYFDQLHFSGHYIREDDIQLVAGLGIKSLRYPVLWEKHEPLRDHPIDWSFTDKILTEIRSNGITPIAGLLHHGSGPRYTSLSDENFPALFASYAGKVAKKFPWLEYYTPINEPLTTARFSGLYALWYPHVSNDVTFVKILLNQVKGIILAMKEIRKINPAAKLVQTEDLSKTYSSPLLAYQAAFENERRWLTYDLLCGKVQPGCQMWNYFLRLGINKEILNFFIENAMPPDIMGFNYYVTSERYIDHDLRNYPPHTYGGNELQEYADVEAVRIDHGNPSGLKVLLQEAWTRYQLPIAVTEAHINSGREDQLRWLNEIYTACCDSVAAGINIKAMTFWSLFGAYGWDNLLTSERMNYEPGAFDLRSARPRPTAIASFIKRIANKNNYNHTLLNQKGWWHQPTRFFNQQKSSNNLVSIRSRPILIIGKTTALGQGFANMCKSRDLTYILTDSDNLDITNKKLIDAFLDAFNPWAVINTAAFEAEKAELQSAEFYNKNATALVSLSDACKARHISFVTFSDESVYDGTKETPYNENDRLSPVNIYGASKAMADRKILKENPEALVIRTSSLFGPWDSGNFVVSILKTLSTQKKLYAPENLIISPTYIPHLVSCSLDLLVDQEAGMWHLTNEGEITWRDFAQKIVFKAGYGVPVIIEAISMEATGKILTPQNFALKSLRGKFLPSIVDAINCFFYECSTLPKAAVKSQITSINARY